MRFGSIAVVGLMVAGLAQGQQGGVSPAQQQPQVSKLQTQLSSIQIVGTQCPGQLQASQQATGGATVWTTALEDQKDQKTTDWRPQGLGVHVDFQGAKNAVKQLELRVSYEPLGLKRIPVAPGTNGFVSNTSERAKNFNLDREAAMRVDADLLVGPAATITRVHLLTATFADGSVWRAPTPDACSVVPNRFMRVNSK